MLSFTVPSAQATPLDCSDNTPHETASSPTGQAQPPCLNTFVGRVVRQYLEDMGSTPPDNLFQVILSEVERPMIQAVLEHTGGNQSQAAELLGITRATLRNRIRRYQL